MRTRLLVVVLMFAGIVYGFAGTENEKFNFPELTNKLCSEKRISWLDAVMIDNLSRKQILELLDSSLYLGLKTERFHVDVLRTYKNNLTTRDFSQQDLEKKYFADAIITYYKDLVAAPGTNSGLKYNEFSHYVAKEDKDLLDALSALKNVGALLDFLSAIEPQTATYNLLIQELSVQISLNNYENIEKLRISLAYYRWIYHFKFKKYIVVNIPTATLQYFEGGNILLTMKVVVGKPVTRTPCFAATCDKIILYPYWHVPRSIAVNEILPAVKKRTNVVDIMNLQVIDKNGHIISPYSINWKQYDRSNFPFTFRQSTGCDNALGVIKFNLTSPYSVYLHDTNLKMAFDRDNRFFSHGCIRVEKPVELANLICPNPIDTNFLNACVKGQESKIISIEPVPVFVVYMPAEVPGDGKVIYKNDVYKLL